MNHQASWSGNRTLKFYIGVIPERPTLTVIWSTDRFLVRECEIITYLDTWFFGVFEGISASSISPPFFTFIIHQNRPKAMSDFVSPISNFPNRNSPQKAQEKQKPSKQKIWVGVLWVLALGFVYTILWPKETSDEKLSKHIPVLTHPDYPMPSEAELQAKIDVEEAEKASHIFHSYTADQVDSGKDQAAFIEINRIAKKTKNDVENYLGKPTRREKTNPSNTPCPCDKYFYKNGSVEVVFINNKADWITINNLNTRDYNSNTILEAIGLPSGLTPTVNTEDVIQWYGMNGLLKISAFPDGNRGIDYAYIKAITD